MLTAPPVTLPLVTALCQSWPLLAPTSTSPAAKRNRTGGRLGTDQNIDRKREKRGFSGTLGFVSALLRAPLATAVSWSLADFSEYYLCPHFVPFSATGCCSLATGRSFWPSSWSFWLLVEQSCSRQPCCSIAWRRMGQGCSSSAPLLHVTRCLNAVFSCSSPKHSSLAVPSGFFQPY